MTVDAMVARGITPESVGRAMDDGTLGAWVAEHQGTVVAFAMAESTEGRLFALFTHPSHAGQGHGSSLLKIAEDFLTQRGRSEIVLDTGAGTTAEQFYLRRGYEVTSRRDGDVFMKKTLSHCVLLTKD
ncbi:GNAT family N-acetyltransferase [Aestuariivirga sp.]|uniref:GNAT family N-acetyltransferase n=1 Tax=Aestuariivirga sp. TaxID=2650926 RepID=UPI0039E5E88C